MEKSTIDKSLSAGRKRQSEKVMQMIGPLLDAWDGLPNDISDSAELAEVAKQIRKINRAMESS